MNYISIGGEGDEQVSTDFSGFLQVEEEESGPGVLGVPEAQDPMGTELPSGVQVPTGTQRTQKVPVKKGSEKRGAGGFGVAGLPAARGLSGPPAERTHPEGLRGSDAGVSAFAEAQLTASETAQTTSGVCGGICGAVTPYIPYTIGEHTGGPTTLLCKVGWCTGVSAQILNFQMIRAYALKDLFLVHNG